ncbi:PilZ domain-containing protein [Oceanidesulfovibrio indonesiensis]|uniref:PilZ domain-containing protein n=1 Tax=Oceanidesulfovibrio indonesiensis TaxID=54767 RepID=UPI001186FC62|nr:PilZ domain-containing protein [Oceanidesulfovibrio indonesiensis]
MEEFDFDIPKRDNKRRAFRVNIHGMRVRIPARDVAYPARDLSAVGMCIMASEGTFEWGEVFEIEIIMEDSVYISNLFAKVQRILPDGLVGVSFEELDPRNEAKLDKLVLETQKRMINQKRARETNQDRNSD